MNTNALVRCCLLALFVLPLGGALSAQTVLWDDDLSAPTLNSNLTARNSGAASTAPVQGGGKLTFNSGTANFGASYIQTATDQNGQALYNGKGVFNFFDHALSMTIAAPAFSATPASGTYDFFALIGTEAASGPQTPRGNSEGVYLRLRYTSAGAYELSLTEKISGGPASSYTLAALPSSITLVLDSSGWAMEIAGTIFSGGGGISRTGSWSHISPSLFEGSNPVLTMGTVNWNAQNPAFNATIDGFSVVVVPEPAQSVALLALVALAGVWFVRRRR